MNEAEIKGKLKAYAEWIVSEKLGLELQKIMEVGKYDVKIKTISCK